MLCNLCIDVMGALMATCERDGARKSYLAPTDHRVEMRLIGAAPQTTCSWVFDEGDGQRRDYKGPCGEEVRIRLAYGKPSIITVDVAVPDGPPLRATTEIEVRDLLIAGLGDSVAAGEGNPDRPIALSDEGFCFRRFGSGSEYYRPGRANFSGGRTCETQRSAADKFAEWARLGARWMSQACHRSLYGYQFRTALALAVENPHVAVTFLPLACTGASIENGVLGTQRARELNCTRSELPEHGAGADHAVAAVSRRRAARAAGAQARSRAAHRRGNDIDFSGLVANVIIDATTERLLVGRGVIPSVETADSALTRSLPRDFAKLRAALKPMVGGDLARVVFVSYGHPALRTDGRPCAGGQTGFDVHPSFKLDGERLRQVAGFVGARFLPQIKAIAQCGAGSGCANPATDRFTFVDAHQQAFAGRGVCARSEQDPEFDRACFMADGKSFAASPVEGATEPLTCGRRSRSFAPIRRARAGSVPRMTAISSP